MEGRLVLAVDCAKDRGLSRNRILYELNSKPVAEGGLRNAVRAELRQRAHRVLYVLGDRCLNVGDVTHAIDVARDAWFDLPIVLLTPKSAAAPNRAVP
jgi:hypothetical protein